MQIKKCIVYILLFSSAAFSQNALTDSLLKIVAKLPNDTAKCEKLNELIENETDNSVWPTYNNALRLIAEKNSKTNNVKLKQRYLKYLADAINNTGFLYEVNGNAKLAIKYYREALDMRFDVGDRKGISNSLNNLGYVYYKLADYSHALEFYNKGLKIQQEIGDLQDEAATLNNIATLYNDQNNLEKAIEFYKKSIKIREKINDKKGLAKCLNNIGTVYYKIKEIDLALENMKRALKIRQEEKDLDGIANSFDNLGSVFMRNNQIDSALSYFKKASEINIKIGDKHSQAKSLNNIAGLYFTTNKINEAKMYYQQALVLAKELGYPIEILSSSKQLYLISKKENNNTKSLEYLELATKMQDSLFHLNSLDYKSTSEQLDIYKTKTVSDSLKFEETSFNLNRKYAVLENELKQKNTLLYIVTAVAILLILILTLIFIKRK